MRGCDNAISKVAQPHAALVDLASLVSTTTPVAAISESESSELTLAIDEAARGRSEDGSSSGSGSDRGKSSLIDQFPVALCRFTNRIVAISHGSVTLCPCRGCCTGGVGAPRAWQFQLSSSVVGYGG